MSRRLQQTLADYVIVAISPALIMTLVGSLIFFLLEVFYQGEYLGRLKFIFAMFVMATVLIGRISIAEGTGYAALFGMPLAVVSALAMARFVRIEGSLSGVGWLINWGLLALVWWCAHKLTWDCTVIDESQDASGAGLLQTVGLESSADGEDQAATETAAEAVGEPDGTTVRYRQPQTWWQRWLDRSRPHAPGVWVVYFSLAALPLFGIGQWFIPAANLESRRSAFWLLCVYVASGLGLLVTTSFLGLRRYLRQRQLEMPSQMAAMWLGLGGALVVGLLFVAWWFPRPSPEYSFSQIPFTFSSPSVDPSRHGFGNDGPQQDQASRTVRRDESQTTESPQTTGKTGEKGAKGETSQSDQGNQKSPQPPSNQPGSTQPGSDPSGSDPSGQNKKGDGKSGAATSGDEPSRNGQPSDKSKSQTSNRQTSGSNSGNNESENKQSPASQAQSAVAPSASGDQTAKAAPASNSSEPNKTAETKPSPPTETPDSSTASTPPPRPPISPQAILQSAFAFWTATLIKWVFYLVLAGIVAYFAWRNWEEVRAGLLRLVQQIRDLWQKLLGRPPRAADEADATPETLQQPRQRSFADFADPFASGQVARQTPNQLVKYSFEALEAWARQHGYPRQPDQTPHEFAAQIAARDAELSRRAQALADLYCRVAYAQDVLPTATVDQVRPLWQHFRRPLATAGKVPS